MQGRGLARDDRRVEVIALVVIATVVAGAALRWLQPVMIPFVLSLFIALGLSTLITWLEGRLRIPHPAAVVVTLLLAGLGFALVGSVVSASIAQLTDNAANYQRQALALSERILASLPPWLLEHVPSGAESLSRLPASAIGNLLLRTTDTVVDLLSKSLLVAIFVGFLLAGQRGVAAASGVWAEVEERIRHYLVIKATVSAATGVLVGITLAVIGVPLALAFGLLAFLLNFIPSIGSLVATVLPIPVVMVSPEIGPAGAVAAVAIPGGIQFAVGNVIEPKWMGDSLDLHPVAILLSLILWGMLWGIAGMLLATPITALMKILFERFDSTRTLADVLAGRLARLRSPGAPEAADRAREPTGGSEPPRGAS